MANNKAPKRQLVGNEMLAGGDQLKPVLQLANKAVVANYDALRVRRQELIRFAADPPRVRLPAPVEAAVADTPSFNQIAYSVLLIAFIAAIAVGTSYINWAFLAYGLLVVAARLPSSQMFVAALISLVIIPVATALQRGTLANDFAVMTFYFLLIGLIRACLELRRDAKPPKKKVKKKLRKA